MPSSRATSIPRSNSVKRWSIRWPLPKSGCLLAFIIDSTIDLARRDVHMLEYGLYMVHLNSLSSAAFESARVGRAVKSNLVFVPDDIQIEDGKLVWKLPAQTTRENWVEPKDLMLIRFCKLHEKSSDQDILKFARRYGVFGAAELNTDAPRFDNELPHAGKRWKVSTEWSTPIGEPLSLWRGLSARYDAT